MQIARGGRFARPRFAGPPGLGTVKIRVGQQRFGGVGPQLPEDLDGADVPPPQRGEEVVNSEKAGCVRCHSGASPASIQVSPSTVLRNAFSASSAPCAASQSRAIRSHDSQPMGGYSADR